MYIHIHMHVPTDMYVHMYVSTNHNQVNETPVWFLRRTKWTDASSDNTAEINGDNNHCSSTSHFCTLFSHIFHTSGSFNQGIVGVRPHKRALHWKSRQ